MTIVTCPFIHSRVLLAITICATVGLGTAFAQLSPNQTQGFGNGRLVTFTYLQNFDCVDQPTLDLDFNRTKEHTSELQSHSFISYAVFCLKKKKKITSTLLHLSTRQQHTVCPTTPHS